MGVTWHWYRFEYALMRGSIHCHGLAKLKDDPGLCNLSQVALNGHIAQEKLTANDYEEAHFTNLHRAVNEGKLAEDEICNYVDSIVTAENPSPPHEGEWVKPDIHPCKKEIKKLTSSELDKDYADLVNSVQRQLKCKNVIQLTVYGKRQTAHSLVGLIFQLRNVKTRTLSMIKYIAKMEILLSDLK